MKIKTIKELYEKIKSGEIEESKIEIILDNDFTGVYLYNEENEIAAFNGYYDIEDLYKLLFPNTKVRWC